MKVNRPATPTARQASSPDAFKKGGGIHNATARNITLEDFIANLREFTSTFDASTMRAQSAAAEIIADRFRDYLRDGVSPELSPLTQALYGDKQYSPLAKLADHVKVVKPGRERWAKGSKFKGKSIGGRFTGQFNPSLITFEGKYERIAFDLQYGMTYIVNEAARKAMLLKASAAKGGNVHLDTSTTIGDGNFMWELPERDFMAFFDLEGTKEIVDVLATWIADEELEKLFMARSNSSLVVANRMKNDEVEREQEQVPKRVHWEAENFDMNMGKFGGHAELDVDEDDVDAFYAARRARRESMKKGNYDR